ncbi:MAG: hypothetical protein DRP96_07745 [Candidatus Neomarinimicrobiota bacterium]|nr:MAG: hypothetical protein DRP96_07745 [Candidatus Neomarinimicrobiota bacterium]
MPALLLCRKRMMNDFSVHSIDHLPLQKPDKSQTLSESQKRELLLRKKTVEMEGLFITQLFKSMEKTTMKEIGGSNNLVSMMFSSVMGQAAAEQGGIGLSDIIYQSLKGKTELPSIDNINTDSLYNSINLSGIIGNANDE